MYSDRPKNFEGPNKSRAKVKITNAIYVTYFLGKF